MNRKEAEDLVYASYMRAAAYQNYGDRDALRRKPELTKEMIRSRAKAPSLLVTGSKGKGSVANMIAAILQQHGKVGLMTSPHIADFRERFRINGRMIEEASFARLMSQLEPEIRSLDAKLPSDECISPMGIQAALALQWFGEEGTDFNVLECGKGARFDDVVNVPHTYAVINSIFLEHTRELGGSLEEIAFDKAHIISGTEECVFVGPQEPQALAVIRQRAEALRVPVRCYGMDFRAENIRFSRDGMHFDVVTGAKCYENLCVPLLGEHQARNAALAVAACRGIAGELDVEEVRRALASLVWPGRMEILSKEPFVLLDACINSASCGNVKQVLKELGIDRAAVVIGIPDDKDYAGVAREMAPLTGTMILTASGNPHYVFTDRQRVQLQEEGLAVCREACSGEAIARALASGLPVVILGTTSLVAEVEQLFHEFRAEESAKDNRLTGENMI